MKQSATITIALLTLAFLGLFLVWPLVQALKGCFFHEGRLSLAFLLEVFQNPIYLEGLWNSLALAVAATGLVILMALPLAVLAARFDFRGKTLLSGLILAPMILPPFVGAIGIQQLLGQYGVLNAILVKSHLLQWEQAINWLAYGRFWAIAVTEALHLYPIFYLNALAAIANLDPALEEAAQNMGCTGWRRFWRITLPLISPGLFAGGIIVFIWSFTELGTPLMFDYGRVTAVQIYDGIKDIGSSPFPYALVIILLFVTTSLYLGGKWFLGRTSYAMAAKAGIATAPIRLRGFKAGLAAAAFGGVFLIATTPHLGVVLTSVSRAWYRSLLPTLWTGAHYLQALGHNLTLPSIQNSLRYASLAMVVDLFWGMVIAYVIVRGTLRWRGMLDALAMLPLAVPGIIVAFGYIAMSQPGRWLSFLNPTANPAPLLIIAYAIRRLPYVVRSAVAGSQQTSVTLEEAAQNLGCPPWRTILRISLPLISANLIAGGLLAFSFAMLEVSDSLMLAQKQAYFPITKALYELFQLLGEGRFVAAALGVWAMTFLLITILAANYLLGKRLGAVFRI
ncbi:MAG: iron ABC transporter permease [Lentisphaerae bacterium]|nr:iron ABC transporter permease [Lentisphaerota bacterium]